jgi:hypothetical protein
LPKRRVRLERVVVNDEANANRQRDLRRIPYGVRDAMIGPSERTIRAISGACEGCGGPLTAGAASCAYCNRAVPGAIVPIVRERLPIPPQGESEWIVR